jgi:hypothetical protein
MLIQRSITAIFAVCLCVASLSLSADNHIPPNMNKAQMLFFFHDHLDGVSKGSHIDYSFKRSSEGDKGFTDRVSMDVKDVHEGGKRDLVFDFLSGENHVEYSPAMGYRGNPVIIHFLERDISMMARDTGGSNGFFRNRIRDAFQKPDKIEEVSFQLNGKTLKGTQIVVTPFVANRYVDNFKMFEHKRYEFIFSDDVPGGVYRIHTQVPDAKSRQVLIDEDMTFQKISPGT